MAEESEGPRKAGPLAAAKAIFWAFFGVRRRGDHAQDLATLTPVQIIVTGIIAGVLFVLSLVLLVGWITG
ncbi:MAG: DUF2970 domain-containing protein [Burkholderiales bacterium]|nr:DUF2970 domain-containing protein [Burkholderiales bacterium]